MLISYVFFFCFSQLPRQYYLPSGEQPCPQIPFLAKIQGSIDVLKLKMSPFESSFKLPDMVTYGDIGRVLVHRTPLRNALDPANGIIWTRDIFKKGSAAELRTGVVETVNLMDPAQTGLMELTLADLNCIAAGSFSIKF